VYGFANSKRQRSNETLLAGGRTVTARCRPDIVAMSDVIEHYPYPTTQNAGMLTDIAEIQRNSLRLAAGRFLA
jgi:hypothetical protein